MSEILSNSAKTLKKTNSKKGEIKSDDWYYEQMIANIDSVTSILMENQTLMNHINELNDEINKFKV